MLIRILASALEWSDTNLDTLYRDEESYTLCANITRLLGGSKTAFIGHRGGRGGTQEGIRNSASCQSEMRTENRVMSSFV